MGPAAAAVSLAFGEPGTYAVGVVPLSDLADAALLAKLSGGSQEAAAVLYDRYGRTVFAIALHIVRDRETAEEITQDVFTSVWKKAHTYRSDQSKVATWISRMARNRAIDELRRRGVRVEKSSVRWEDGVGEDPAGGRDPADQAEMALERQRVRAALASLPAEQREALALAYFRGCSQSEIAEALGQPLGTVKTRIRMGMQKLRLLLEDRRDGFRGVSA